MFHLFTLDGKQADLPLEKMRPNIRVNRIEKRHRSRKLIEGEGRGAEERRSAIKRDSSTERGPGAGEEEENRYGHDAYRKALEDESTGEQVYHAVEIMSSPAITIEPGITAAEAWKKFNDFGVRHMPVISETGNMIGILSERDLLKQLTIRDGRIEDAVDITVRDIMSPDVIASGLYTDIRRIARAMLEQHVGMMPVVNEKGALTGVVTRSDILHAIIHHPKLSLWA